MKITILLLFTSLITLVSAQTDENEALEKQILEQIIKNTKVTVSLIKDESLAKCFDAIFYDTEVKEDLGEGWSTQKDVYAKTASGLQKVILPSSNADMPALVALMKPTFKLKTEVDGVTMQAALKKLFPRKFKKDKERIVQNGTTWNFITDTFFKRFSGFVIETDKNGKITRFKRSLEIEG